MKNDLISRQAAIDAMNGIIDRFEQILRDIRESKLDDSVCGMCEYDGAFIGQSGDWCNECPGFDKDDCFKLSDKCRKRWLESVEMPSAQPYNKGLWTKQELAPQTLLFCSLCGCRKPQGVTGNFCPNCGADMRGEEDGKQT